jgi:hypothetical protein
LSRTALSLALLLAPAPAFAQSVIAAPPDPLGDLARRQALAGDSGDEDCEAGSGEEIVVCARGGRMTFRVPYRPQPGARPVRAIGELPRYGDLGSDDCHRLCYQPVMVHIDVGRLISNPGGALRDMLRGR